MADDINPDDEYKYYVKHNILYNLFNLSLYGYQCLSLRDAIEFFLNFRDVALRVGIYWFFDFGKLQLTVDYLL